MKPFNFAALTLFSGILATAQITFNSKVFANELNSSNVVCFEQTKDMLGQVLHNYCTSNEPSFGVTFEDEKQTRNSDRSIKYEFKAFNKLSAAATVEVYDSNKNLVDVQVIDGYKPPIGLTQSGSAVIAVIPQLWSKYPPTDFRRTLKEQNISVTIPAGGYVAITKSSNIAIWYNSIKIAVDIAKLSKDLAQFGKEYRGDFTEADTTKKFILGYAKEVGKQSRVNIFTGSPTIQSAFSQDFINKNVLAEVLVKFVQYSIAIEPDLSKNPILSAFSDIAYETFDILAVKALATINKGLALVVEATNIVESALYIQAQAINLANSIAYGKKATVTLTDSVEVAAKPEPPKASSNFAQPSNIPKNVDNILSQSSVLDKLTSIPVFILSDASNNPVLSDGGSVLQFFLNPDDAIAFLNQLKDSNPSIGYKSLIATRSLKDAYEIIKKNEGRNNIKFQIVPSKSSMNDARDLLASQGKPTDQLPQVPIFYASASNSGKGGLLTLEMNGKQTVPFFLALKDLQALIDRAGKSQPNVANSTKISVTNLFQVLDSMAAADASPDTQRFTFIASRNVFNYVTGNPSNSTNISTQSQSKKHPAEIVVSEFSRWFLENDNKRDGSSRNKFSQQKEAFDPELYQQLVNGFALDSRKDRLVLNFNPFFGGQVGTYKIEVRPAKPSPQDDDSLEVIVDAYLGLRSPGSPYPTKVVVVRNGSRWQIKNFFHLRDNFNLLAFLKTLPRAKSSQSTRTSSSVCLTQSPGLFTWDELLPRAREARGGGVYYDDLPSPFKDGLIWLDTGADNVRVYVFEKNLCPPITKERFSRNNNYDVVEKHVMSGQALEFLYYGRNNDSNVRREFNVRRGGYTTCILTTCLTAKSLTQQQIVKILRSARRGN